MATSRDKILGHPKISKACTRKWRKRQVNKYMRRQPVNEDDCGGKTARKPMSGESF